MKKIIFTKLAIKNFMSIGETPVVINFKEGFNIIRGYNRDEDDIANGTGKSSIISAFYFAIFGESINDLPRQYIVNRKIGKRCVVRLEFEDVSSSGGTEYFVVERSISPNKLNVWKNDIDVTKSTMPETNKYVADVLSADKEVFENCIIMQANFGSPFMTKKKTDKKNFIESIFNLGVFSDMQKRLKDDMRDVRSKFDIENSALCVLDDTCKKYEEKIEDISNRLNEQKSNIEKEKRRLQEAIENEEKKILELEKKGESFDASLLKSYNNKLETVCKYENECMRSMGELKAELRVMKKSMNDIKNIGEVCPSCKRTYSPELVGNNKRLLAEYQEKCGVLVKKYGEIEEKLNKISDAKKTLNKLVENEKSKETESKLNKIRINSSKNSIEQYKQMMERVTEKYAVSPVDEFIKTLDETQLKKDEKKGIVEKIQKHLSMMNVCEYVLGEEGVRSYIVNKLLELLNNRIRFYLKSFKSTFEFTFNEYFEEEIKDINGIVCMYNNCSGAEKKKIDLAISFAFLDIIKYHRQIDYNIAFYDEILDSSVDTKSLEHIVNFIYEQARINNKSVYIVTHKTDVTLPNITETVLLEKTNGFTKRITNND